MALARRNKKSIVNENAFGFVTKGVDRHLRGGRRTIMWKKTMRMILDRSSSDHEIMVMLQFINGSNEVRAHEIAIGDEIARVGTLLHACAVAGNIPIATQLMRFGADPKVANYAGKTPMDLALEHGQTAMTVFLEPTRTEASTDLRPLFAKDERDLVWSQRKRRKALERQLAEARLSVNERTGALQAAALNDKEEWMHLEGMYQKRGLAADTIDKMKTRRSMY